MPDVIVARHLVKRFKDITAVEDLSFSVPSGIVYGFLGQNGAGKSTSIRMLLTLVTPTSGTIEMFGMNLKKRRREILMQVGCMVEHPETYKYLSGLENLRIFAAMSGVKLSDKKLLQHLDRVGLANRAQNLVKTYSQGMKQRLGIGIALVHNPALVILDEPMNGLDPQGMADIRNLILHLSKEQKKTVFISSHLLNEMELMADSMLIIDKGKKIIEGKMSELFNPAETEVEFQTNGAAEVYQRLQQTGLAKYLSGQRGESVLFRVHRNGVPALVKQLVQMDVEIISLRSRHSLENYFLSLTTENQHVDAFKD